MAARNPEDVQQWLIKDLWDKYEEIAMHFNDLLMRLRSQALAGVAALSVLGGVFAKAEESKAVHWEFAVLLFLVLSIAWVAVWVIDFFYYNRLLLGAVHELLSLEKLSKTQDHVPGINISTAIEMAVANELPIENRCRAWRLKAGRVAFYVLVFVALLSGLVFSIYEWRNAVR